MSSIEQGRRTTRTIFGRKAVSPAGEVPAQAAVVVATQRVANPAYHPRNWPFRLKLGLATVILSLIPFLLAIALIAWHADGIAADSQTAALRRQTQTMAAYLGNILGSDVRTMQGLAKAPGALHIATSAPKNSATYQPLAVFGGEAMLGPGLSEAGTIYITSAGGTVLAATRPVLVGHSPRGLPATAQAMHTKKPVAVLGIAAGSHHPAIIIAAPIMRGLTAVGAIVGEFDPSSLYAALLSQQGTLVAPDGRIVTGHSSARGQPIPLVGSGLTTAASRQPEFAALQADQPVQLADGSWAARVLPGAQLVLHTAVVPP
ncbi:MAG: hypothetical protein JWO42_990, partial [Chloroflexi bacterium]|nr:hypothetical protein [Chloroflexota bacterium]